MAPHPGERMQQETTGEAPPFADLLRRHRLAAGLTQQELCERSGISVQAISALERGWRRSPHRDTVAMLADCLGLKPVERTAFAAAGRRPPVQPRPRSPVADPPAVPAAAGLLVG